MEKRFRVETTATASDLFEIVSDLATFPEWIEVVHKVEASEQNPLPTSSLAGSGAESEPLGPTWWVVLRARLGSLSRSKRLRMGRSVYSPPDGTDELGHVRFDRVETDGRDHADWTMEIHVGPIISDDDGQTGGRRSWADCRLFYGGDMWSGLLDGQLDSVATRATRQLQELATAA